MYRCSHSVYRTGGLETVTVFKNLSDVYPGKRNFFPLYLPWLSVITLEIAVLAPLRIAESDIWFHLRNAHELLQRHQFLRSDLYTFTSAGAPLVNHEWLAELPYYLGFQLCAQRGLLTVYLAALWGIFGVVYYTAVRRNSNYIDAALITMLGVALGAYSFGPRMHHLGWLCMAILLDLLDRFERGGKGIWLLPLLFALWINLHGSWLFGLVVVAIYGVAGSIRGQWGRVVAEGWNKKKLRQLVVIAGVSILALFANPYGYRLLGYPFDMIFRQKANLQHVVEWQSVDFQALPGKMALLMILGVVAAAWFSPEHWRLVDVMLTAFALVASLLHVRLLIFAAIVLVPILAPRLHFFSPYAPEKDKPWLNLAFSLGIAALIVALFPSSATLNRRVETQFPGKALELLQETGRSGRLFHYYDFGGYIEWNRPETKTFADGRTDIFVHNGVFDDYLKINMVQDPLDLLDKYRIDYILFPPDKSLAYVLDHNGEWRRIYQDRVANLYERTDSASEKTQVTQPLAMVRVR